MNASYPKKNHKFPSIPLRSGIATGLNWSDCQVLVALNKAASGDNRKQGKRMAFDTALKPRVLSVKDVVVFLGKSIDWVYSHAEDVGSVKRGGSWLFPAEGDIYECLFQGWQGIPIRPKDKGQKLNKSVVQDKTGRLCCGSRKTKEGKNSFGDGRKGRHGLA